MNISGSETDAAFVLHSVSYKETSLVVELFCKRLGRLPVLAKGAKRPYSLLRPVLLGFQPIQVRFSGRSEVKTLQAAEWLGGWLPPEGKALFSAYYLNELLMRGLGRDDPHPTLFDLYAKTLEALSQGGDPTVCVRAFEVGLLKELGYGLDWSMDVEGKPLMASQDYMWLSGQGWCSEQQAEGRYSEADSGGHWVSGLCLLEVQAGLMSRQAAHVLRPVTRQMLSMYVAPQGLVSRVWMEQLVRS